MGIRENIMRLRHIKGLTQDELAHIAGVSRGAVSQWEGGISEPRMSALQKIADYYGLNKSNLIEDNGLDVTVSELLGEQQTSSNLKKLKVTSTGRATVPLVTLGKVHAGALTDEMEAESIVEVPMSVHKHHKDAFALLVEGDCMDKLIPDGAVVLVDPYATPISGSIVVVETQDYQAIMRKWLRGNTALILTACSHKPYDDIVFSDADQDVVKLVGVVVWYQAAKEM